MNKCCVIAVGLILLASLGSPVWAAAVASVDNVEIAYTVEGSGKPALVFIHGWSCDATYWKKQLPAFAADYTVVAIDLAGHGKSGVNREKWTIEAYGADVVAVVEALDLDRVILIGHSMGGRVNIEAAKKIPDRVIALVGVDTYQDLAHMIHEEQKDPFLAGFKTDFAATTNGFVRSMFPEDADSTLVDWVANDMASAPPEVGIGSMENLLDYEVTGLKALEIRVYCINSDKFPTNIEAGESMAYAFSVKLIPGRGHFLHMEDPHAFNEVLEEIIDEIAGE